MILFIMHLACSTSNPKQITTSDIPWKDGTLSMAIASLEAKCGIQTPSEVPDDFYENIKKLQQEISLLDEQVVELEKRLDELQGSGVGSATMINFDPRATTLSAKTVQEALDEMMVRLSVLEHHVLDEMGDPGPGLFEIPKDKKKGQPKGGGVQGQNGPPGPPPNNGPQGGGNPQMGGKKK